MNALKYPEHVQLWHIYTGVVNMDVAADVQKLTNMAPEFKGMYSFDTTLGCVANESNTSTQFQVKTTKAGDVITVRLNLEDQTLSCQVNGQDIGTCITGLPQGGYRLLASMWYDET